MSNLYLGIDTSNYTTSLAIVDQMGNIIEDKRKALFVESGKKGLRQQEALFQHIKNLPDLLEEMSTDLTLIKAIGASTRPRTIEGSYMPVFLAGENTGRIISKSLQVPFKRFSHQEGHIGCCLLGNKEEEPFLSLHLSGGTTEVVYTRNEEENLLTQTIGGTLDISMGQLIDRIGVYLGMDFPCGVELDRIARNGEKIVKKLQYRTRDGWINLSGYENLFKKLLGDGKFRKEDVVYTMFMHLGDIIGELIREGLKDYPVKKIYVAGGVSANSVIRKSLENGINEKEVVFPENTLSTDNGVGVAYLAACKKGWEE
ncbi:hypothetical protein [Gudongella sp. DL1XJH-153]|uniref:Kae1-like domain-containing protein n=1 Tax=Gudongella sp. DL1XJH-153 TaxID=3409804 RepID=UPI003BB4FCEB